MMKITFYPFERWSKTEEKPKRKAGHPKGVPSPGSGDKPKPRFADVIETSGGVISEPPYEETGTAISRRPAPLNFAKTPIPETMLPVPQQATAVPQMVQTVLAIRATVDLDNPATLWNAMEQYLQLCATSGMKISNSTMYMACGVGRNDIHHWEYGLRRQNNPEYRRFAIMCREICAAAREQYGLEGQVNPILTIFHQKFYDGFKDNPPDNAVENPLGDIEDPQKLAEKYSDIIVD